MKRNRNWRGGRWLLLCGIGALLYRPVVALVDIPLRNWTVPARASRGLTPYSDLTSALPFVAVTPCRIVDTRGPDGTFGGPTLSGGTPRTFPIPVNPSCLGIPATALAYSFNLTVVASVSAPPGSFITVWPAGGAQPVVSTLNFGSGQVIANAAIVPAGTAGGVSVVSSADTHLLIDINGYWAATLNPPSSLAVSVSSGASAISGTNTSFFSLTSGVRGRTTGSGSAGVRGEGTVSAERAWGVLGLIDGQDFVGYPAGHWGVVGAGREGGVYGAAEIGGGSLTRVEGVVGVARGQAQFQPATGVRGAATGFVVNNATGVVGTAGLTGGAVIGYPGGWGVAGMSPYGGVYGATSSAGFSAVQGDYFYDAFGSYVSGRLATKLGINKYGVFSSGDFGGTGAKFFVEPHPSDPDKVIRYIALEGPEAGTYFRGTARATGGRATIDVPESFRDVTDESGITVQLTPIGELATLAVASQDLERVVVLASKDVAFHYQVNGVRRAFKGFQAISEGGEFRPESATAKAPAWLTEDARRRLVDNGTYNPDGSVNLTTARRRGWTREWEARAKEQGESR